MLYALSPMEVCFSLISIIPSSVCRTCSYFFLKFSVEQRDSVRIGRNQRVGAVGGSGGRICDRRVCERVLHVGDLATCTVIIPTASRLCVCCRYKENALANTSTHICSNDPPTFAGLDSYFSWYC